MRGIIFILLMMFLSSCRCFVPKNASQEVSAHKTCSFDKQWFEQSFRVKNIFRIDTQYNDTLLIIMFEAQHADDAEQLMLALEAFTEDIHMTTSPKYNQIYISKATAEKICQGLEAPK